MMKKLVYTMGIITIIALILMLCSGVIYRGTKTLAGQIINVADTATTNIQTQEVETETDTVEVTVKEETMVNSIYREKSDYIVLFEDGTYFKGTSEEVANAITDKTGSLTVVDGKRLYSVIGGTLFEYDITKIW